MSEFLQTLREDHKHLSKVLNLLRRETLLIQAGRAANYRLMEDIVHYIMQYPDVFHHPHEEIMFEQLKKKSPELKQTIGDIEREHKELADASARLYALIEGIESGAMTPRDEIVKESLGFVQKNYDHMHLEEDTIFPSAESLLDEQDWLAIKENMADSIDPLFGTITHDSYATLYQAILEESK
jgi:hemerythrin-like domain-containing protein